MSERREYSGYWYLPNQEDNRLYGTLRVGDKIELDVNGVFENLEEHLKLYNTPVINGFTTCGKKITLLNNTQLNSLLNIPGIPVQCYSSRYMIIGNNYNSINDFMLSSISCNYTNLNEWVKELSFIRKYKDIKDPSKEIDIEYKRPQGYRYELNDYTLKIDFLLRHKCSMHEINMKQDVIVTFDNLLDNNLEFDLNFINDFSDFLTLCTGERIIYYDIKGKDKNGEKVEIKISMDDYDFNKKIRNKGMLIPFSLIKENFQSCLENWNNKKEKLSPVISYVVDSYKNVFFEPLSFIKVVQAMETFSRRMRTNCKIDQEDHKKKIDYIIDHIEKDEYKKWLNEKLKYSNEPSLSSRLKEIFKEVDFIVHLSSKQRKNIVKKIVDTRNYYTHFDESKKDLTMSIDEMYYISKYMLIILRVLIMKEFGIDETFINKKLEEIDDITIIKSKVNEIF